MSMHNVPLTDIELNGLIKHGLDIGTPSQLADAFRRGVAWASDHYIERLRVIHEHLTRHDCSFDLIPSNNSYNVWNPCRDRAQGGPIAHERRISTHYCQGPTG
jgi:hypothetical protein